jgi:protein-S-isoprenylcysteine O-methyltransferase Ste14
MTRLTPLVYFLIAILLMPALHLLLPLGRLVAFPWRLLGMLPLMAGIILNLLADRSFKQHKTTVKPCEKPSALVTDGVFRLSRHPMYLGMVLILAGIAILLGSVTPWFILLALAALYEACFVGTEECMLEETFGAAYRAYKKQVRRWI